MTWAVRNLWLIPALPLLAAGVTALLKQRHRTLAASLAIGSMALAFFLACGAFARTLGEHAERQVHNFAWFQLGPTTLQLGWVLDPLTASMLVMVTFVGALIFIYSVGYMAHDGNFTRFFCFLSLFAAAMLGVVLANSLLLLFICWELVGFASYILIGFWYHKPSAAAAAKKAFIVTRIGDLGFFVGLLWLYAETGSLLFYDAGHGCLESSALAKLVGQTTLGGMAVSTAVSLLIFCGAMGKSGQVPLHVCLPDAMEGPTPVSALIHAATMVAAGVFLVARVYPLMEAVLAEPVAAEVTRLNFPALVRNEKSEPPHVVSYRDKALTPALSLSERERENRRQVGGQSDYTLQFAMLAANAERGASSGAADQSNARTTVPPLPGGEGRGEGECSSDHHDAPIISSALKAITWIGAITAVFAALIAVAQTDIKRILAYSTVSQLGYMMMGLGVGGVAVGMFHLITHAFFKALLFLGAGSVIHGCHEEQDIRRMGGLRKLMPVTFATYAVGMMALCGVPLFFSGFWSKDEILHAARGWPVSPYPFYLGLCGAFLTAFYMTRQMWFLFFGSSRRSRGNEALTSHQHDEHGKSEPPHVGSYEAHESPLVMTFPLIVLAVFAVLLGFFGTPAWPWFQEYLNGQPAEFGSGKLFQWDVLSLLLSSTVIVAVGIVAAWWLYGRKPVEQPGAADALEGLQPDLFLLLREKFFVDELYEGTVVRFNAGSAWLCDWLDRRVWNGAVQLVSYLVLGGAWLNRFVDEYLVNPGFDQGCRRIRRGGGFLSRLQNGRAQNYLRVIGVALTVLVLMLIWGCGAS